MDMQEKINLMDANKNRILFELLNKLGLSQRELNRLLGFKSPGHVWQLIKGNKKIGVKSYGKIEKLCMENDIKIESEELIPLLDHSSVPETRT